MPGLQAAAATASLVADDAMVIAGGILPATCAEQEGELQATALLISADQPVCLVSCDVLAITRDLADEAALRVADECGVPFENVLITATHTHHAPSTVRVHAYGREEAFCRRLVDGIVSAARQARSRLEDAADRPNECEAELLYALGQEATVGQNSRWLMADGQISWTGHDASQMVRPTGPHDPDLPVLVLRRPAQGMGPEPAGAVVGALFCHATHNIGTHRADTAVRSPGFLGLAAQELGRKIGAPCLFFPGAFGSSHRLESPDPREATLRVVTAVNEAMTRLRPALAGPVVGLKRPFTCRVRSFDEAQADRDVRRWCETWFSREGAAEVVRVFAAMRRELASRSGSSFDTWLQVIRLGEVAIVGIPGEMFGSLGLQIRRRSPFRETFVVGLANDEVGYIPDRQAYELGGYQVWPGAHSVLEEGTGEAMVEAVLELLDEALDGPTPGEPRMGLLGPDEALALQRFYNDLSPRARWLFRPLGWQATYLDCAQACRDAVAGHRFDVVYRVGTRVVGWAFLLGMDGEVPHLGVAVADAWVGAGLGRRLLERLIEEARARNKRAIALVHVKDNERAGGLYRRLGFEVTGEHLGADGNEYWQMELKLRP